MNTEYCCPRCKAELIANAESYACSACQQEYPIVLGIPDFRVFPDPYIDIEEDRKKAKRLFEQAAVSDFQGLVEYYWSITSDTPHEMATRFTAQAITAVERGRHLLDSHSIVKSKLQSANARVLDLGTRTGGLLMAAAESGADAVGIDIGFRWLIIARKRFEEAKLKAQFVCCCAEFLPFRNQAFNLVVAENLLEHSTEPKQCLDEAHRVLSTAGFLFTTTWNRLSLAPEPHVRLWGVGWMPRKVARRYVHLRKNANYEHVRLLSIFGLKRMIRRGPFRRCDIILPAFSESELRNISSAQRMAIAIYHRIKDWPLLSGLLRVISPVLHVICARDSR